ncbi:unnamed protein product [Ostreobium quekettii]|uniref:Uncharacterized protein n=1 Tax=Ostreobium quekettii TaxID=121088 RepID=A0A8S1JCQ6_9CHLO|nr:unnamed protein product [Ostreobium quekettii]
MGCALYVSVQNRHGHTKGLAVNHLETAFDNLGLSLTKLIHSSAGRLPPITFCALNPHPTPAPVVHFLRWLRTLAHLQFAVPACDHVESKGKAFMSCRAAIPGLPKILRIHAAYASILQG